MDLNDILRVALQWRASDIHLKAGLPPMLRIDGELVALNEAGRMSPEVTARIAYGIMTQQQRDRFQENWDADLAYGVQGLGRFRVNVFQQRGAVGLVLRSIPYKIQSVQGLMLPKVIENLALEHRGLLLVTGTTGSGKSTTLAAMIDHINTHRTCHVTTIEDPIEFLIRDKRSIIDQREVGADTKGFAQALKAALRQDPDVILVGEMRDLETIETALLAAETGHLVVSTLHTLDATETVHRIISVFPPHQQQQIRLQLASVLRACISQRLVSRADGLGRVPAVEILIVNELVKELLENRDRTKEIRDVIARSRSSYGMQTFDQSLMWLWHQGYITYEEALKQSSRPSDFALRASGISTTDGDDWDQFDPNAGRDEGASSGG